VLQLYIYLCVDYICCRNACLLRMQGLGLDGYMCLYIVHLVNAYVVYVYGIGT
jgi:hypothetical protein